MKQQFSERDLVSLYRGFFIFGDAASLKILFELDRFGPKNFSELKSELGINPTTLSKKLQILAQVGIISSEKTHDNLRVYYKITDHKRPLKRFLDAFERLSAGI